MPPLPKLLFHVVGLIVACKIRNGSTLNIARLVEGEYAINFQVERQSPVNTIAIWTHRKTGTDLFRGISDELAQVLGMPHYTLNLGAQEQRCYPNAITHHINPTTPYASGCVEEFPDIRALHVVRHPMSMLASAYCYTKKLHLFAPETLSTITMGAELRREPMDVGLRRICEDEKSKPFYMASMIEIHERMNSSNIMEVGLEVIENDFNRTMRSIFEHLAGNDPRVDLFIERASRWDLNRYQLDESSIHASDEGEKREAKVVLQSMLEAGDPCIQWAAQMAERMGFK